MQCRALSGGIEGDLPILRAPALICIKWWTRPLRPSAAGLWGLAGKRLARVSDAFGLEGLLCGRRGR